MIIKIFQVETVERLLKTSDGVTILGVLLALIFLLIYHIIRQEKKYSALQDNFNSEQSENKKLLIELVSKSILATEQNTQAINTLRDVYNTQNR